MIKARPEGFCELCGTKKEDMYMLEGIAKELEQHVGKVLSFYLKDCPDLHRKAIKVEKVTENMVEGFLQKRVIVLDGMEMVNEEVKGTDDIGFPTRYYVSRYVTANGQKVFLRQDSIMAWGFAEPYEASTERMPTRMQMSEDQLNHYK